MDSIERLSIFTLVASDQAYWKDMPEQTVLAPYPDSGELDLYPSTMPAQFYDPMYVGLSEWKVAKRIDHAATGFGATIYTRDRSDGKTDFMVALQGTRGPNLQDWSGNLVFGWDKWQAAEGGQQLLADLRTALDEGRLSGDIYFTGQSLGGALAEYAAYEFKARNSSFDNSRIALTTFNGLGGIAGLQLNLGGDFNPGLL